MRSEFSYRDLIDRRPDTLLRRRELFGCKRTHRVQHFQFFVNQWLD